MTLKAYRDQVKLLFEAALPHCVDTFRHKLSNGQELQEPDYTAGLAIGIPKMLEGDKEAHKLGLRFHGGYIHQKPYVSYDDDLERRSCELGDLLVLCCMPRGGKETLRSALFQLKMADGKNGINKAQLYLYEEWPKFWFSRSKKRAETKVYDVRSESETRGAMYLFVHPLNATENVPNLSFAVEPPSKCLACADAGNVKRRAFQDFLADLVVGKEGREIHQRGVQSESGCTWSDMIWEAISRIEGSYIVRKRILEGRSQLRMQGEPLEFRNDGGLLDVSKGEDLKETHDGVATGGMGVLIIVGTKDIERRNAERTESVCERLKRSDIVDRLLKLGYKAGNMPREYTIADPETKVTHTVHLKRYKRNYTLADVKGMFDENFICEGCAESFWDDRLTSASLLMKMLLSGCFEEEEKCGRISYAREQVRKDNL